MTPAICTALVILFGLIILGALAWAMWPTEDCRGFCFHEGFDKEVTE